MTYATISAMRDGDWLGGIAGLRHSGGEAHLVLEVLHTNKALLGALARWTGVPKSQLVLMRVLAGAGKDGVGVLDLARIISVNGAAVTRQVKQMEARGLVIRRGDKTDGRKSRISLSAAGRRLFMEIHRRVHEIENRLCADLDQRDLETAKRVLAHLRGRIENGI